MYYRYSWIYIIDSNIKFIYGLKYIDALTMFEQFTNDFFQNTDLDYNVLNENVYSNMLSQSFKANRNKSDPVMEPPQKSTIEKFLDGSEPIVPTQLELQTQKQPSINIPLTIPKELFSNEMIAILSMIVLILYIYTIISKKIDRLFNNQSILNNNIMKNTTTGIIDSDGATILPKMN